MTSTSTDPSANSSSTLFQRLVPSGIGRFVIKLVFWPTLVAVIGVLMTVLGLYWAVHSGQYGKLPTSEELVERATALPQASEIYSSDGVLLGRFYLENRTNIGYKEIPQKLLNALLATEDIRFFEHSGIDYKSFIRVFFRTVVLGDPSGGGGSTISQQLIKNLYPREDHGRYSLVVNKFREIILAGRLEEAYDKKQILVSYLNTVPFGESAFGIRVASLRYFSKEPMELDWQESATLVGMLKGNSAYNPRRYPEKAKERRNIVLAQLAKYGFLSQTEAEKFQEAPIQLQYNRLDTHDGMATYFREALRMHADRYLGGLSKESGKGFNPYTDGLKIHTTLNSRMQAMAEEAVEYHLDTLQKVFNQQLAKRPKYWKPILRKLVSQTNRYKRFEKSGIPEEQIWDSLAVAIPSTLFINGREMDTLISPFDSAVHYFTSLQAGFMAINPKNGEVMAWVGGNDLRNHAYDHVLAKRQVGSTFKPIVYANALMQGIEPCELVGNYRRNYGGWSPRNADGKYGGFYSVKGGLANSVNTVTVEMIRRGNVDSVIALTRAMGITAPLPRNLTLALGTASISLYEMVGAYSVFAGEGIYREPVIVASIEDKKGRLIYRGDQGKQAKVMEPDYARMVTDMLQAVVDSGTARRLRFRYGFEEPIAGKTGTTQKQRDGWFIGYTPNLLAGVWVGADNPSVHFTSMHYGQGANTALPIWAEFFKRSKEDPYMGKQLVGEFSASELTCPLYSRVGNGKRRQKKALADSLKKPQETIASPLLRYHEEHYPKGLPFSERHPMPSIGEKEDSKQRHRTGLEWWKK